MAMSANLEIFCLLMAILIKSRQSMQNRLFFTPTRQKLNLATNLQGYHRDVSISLKLCIHFIHKNLAILTPHKRRQQGAGGRGTPEFSYMVLIKYREA